MLYTLYIMKMTERNGAKEIKITRECAGFYGVVLGDREIGKISDTGRYSEYRWIFDPNDDCPWPTQYFEGAKMYAPVGSWTLKELVWELEEAHKETTK